MARMVRNGTVQGLEVSERELKSKTEEACDVCIKAKHTAASHPASDTRASRPLELVHSDLMGPFKPMSAGGNQFLLTATDDYSGFAAVRPLKHKSEAPDAFKKILLAWERQHDSRVQCVRTDRGEEYAAFNKWCDEQGIQRERSAAYKPQQNGRAERLNRTLTERTRAMLLQSDIPKKFWAEAFSTATQLYNVAPKFKQSKSPHELFHDRKPDVQAHVRLQSILSGDTAQEDKAGGAHRDRKIARSRARQQRVAHFARRRRRSGTPAREVCGGC